MEKLDKSLFVFSKKQIIMPSAGITEFYSIKLRYPIVDDNVSVTMMIHARGTDDIKPPATASVASNDEHGSQTILGSVGTVEPPSPNLTAQHDDTPAQQNVYIYPQRVTFSRRRTEAHISIQI